MTVKDLLKVLDEENNYYAFEYKGFKCRMIRHITTDITDAINNKGFASFNWCGYIGIPKEHPLYGASYHDLFEEGADPLLAELSHYAHGGFTYSTGYLYMQPEEDLWWLGFDCAHLGDISNLYKGEIDTNPRENATYKDAKYVKDNLIQLADILANNK